MKTIKNIFKTVNNESETICFHTNGSVKVGFCYLLKYLKLSIILLIFSFKFSFAQTDTTLFDTKGTDFWLAFLPNWHNNYSSQYNYLLERTDSLYIFIVADEPTTGNIEYRDKYGNTYNEQFTIMNTDEIYKFKVSHYDFALHGYNRSGTILQTNDSRNQSEVVARNSFHVSTDYAVTVYAHSQSVMTSDAFLVLPTGVLGKEYLIMTYNSDGSTYAGYNQIGGSSTPSQFLIVATEDNTVVNINPSTEVYRRGFVPFQIPLNKGEVFLVQARITANNLKSDLTGTSIESNKPVAVFAGQQRSKIPVTIPALTSRDYLCGQMPPVSTWGKNAFVIPFATPFDATTVGSDLYRVLSGSDGTDIYINGFLAERKNKGEYFEKPINGSATIEATGPILVAQFKKTSKFETDGGQPLSDPFMMTIPPVEQFMSNYSIINIQAYEETVISSFPITTRAEKVYDLHYCSIVAPGSAIDKTYLDGVLINSNRFIKIQGSDDYYFANIQVSEDAHRISSSSKIGVYVYGYGQANSYGYVGGMSMSQFDFKKPKILSSDSCYNLMGMIYDNRPGDSKISTVTSPDDTKINCKVNIERFQPYADSVYFEAELLDNYLDGKFEITAIDSIGHDSTAVLGIPGFTVSVETMLNSRELYVHNARNRTNVTYCPVFNLQNYGDYLKYISKTYMKNNSAISITPSAPFEINKHSKFGIELCFHFAQDTIFSDTLIISDGCTERPVMVINFEFKSDDKQPDLTVKSDSCRNYFEISVADTLEFDTGIDHILTSHSNCTIKKITNKTSSLTYIIEVIDPYKDARFSITVTDSSGNQVTYADTIQGFTLTYPQFDSSESLLDYGLEKIGTLNCDSLLLHNYGTMPFVIDNIFLKNNQYFSIPQYQFPLIILPNESLKLDVCFNPNSIYDSFLDTLVLTHNCLSKEIALAGLGDTVIYFGEADCNVKIKATAHTIDKKYNLEQNIPNPVVNTTKVIFNLIEKSDIRLSIHDILGNERFYDVKNNVPVGRHEFLFDLEFLPQGIYLYSIMSNKGILNRLLIKQ